MREVYPYTPRIRNELIVRRRPRAVIVNARKKLILAILERSGTENLGLEGYRPDMSMFRTVLLLTRLYRCDGRRSDAEDSVWRYGAPEELADTGLRHVWDHLRDYLTFPAEYPKPLDKLVPCSMQPRTACGPGSSRSFSPPRCGRFRPDQHHPIGGQYVSDLLPSTIEAMAAHPDEYQVLVPELTVIRRNSSTGYRAVRFRG